MEWQSIYEHKVECCKLEQHTLAITLDIIVRNGNNITTHSFVSDNINHSIADTVSHEHWHHLCYGISYYFETFS